MPTSSHPTFEPLRTARIKSLNIEVEEFRHRKTGTPHFHLAADSAENVFLVGLRTVPTDSTGVAHILEHTVLCGSEKYPVRDPFFMMIRRSLNTFMNAFTSSDWTAYPFASQSRKDYFNLLDVYLDSVFFSRLHELDFMQEGHRLEFSEPEDSTSDLTYKGVVFNEMKGAMSAPTSLLWQTLSKHIFPNNTYHYNSGGDPEAIPNLTYEELVDFYKTHYHPSNAVFMTYGDIAASELQEKFDKDVLSRFDPLDETIAVNKTQRFYSPIRVEEAYATNESDLQNKTYFVLGWLLGESSNLTERLRAHMLSSVLLDNSASPLLQALEQTPLGSAPSALCGVEDSGREMLFVCGLDGIDASTSGECENLILDVLKTVAEEDVPQERIDAVLHQLEMSQREIRGDGMPFGLQLVLSGLSTAMLRGDTLSTLDLDPALETLREEASMRGFIPKLINSLLLDNPHRVTLSMRPDPNISELRNKAETNRLAGIKSELTEEQKKQLVVKAKELAQRQSDEDDPEILPKVTLEDVPSVLKTPKGTDTILAGCPAVHFAQGTNGLVYQQVVIDFPSIAEKEIAYLPLYTSFLAELGSGGRDYLQTQVRQAEVTGGIGAYLMQRGSIDDEQAVRSYLVLRGKALVRNSNHLAELLHDTLNNVRFDEIARLKELVAQTRTSREQSVTGSGHSLAMLAAASGMSPSVQLSHQLNGLAGIKSLKALDSSFTDDQAVGEFAQRLERIHQAVQSAPRQYMLVAEESNLNKVSEDIESFFGHQSNVDDFSAFTLPPIRSEIRQCWVTSTEVNFCAKAYPTVTSTHPDAPALAVLGPLLRNGYLHRAIRETGGAYGGGASQDMDSASFRFFSYRDPRLTETLEDFDKSIHWLLHGNPSDRLLEEAILNLISSIDKPGSPAGEARSTYQNTLFGRTPEKRNEFRQKILSTTMDDLNRVASTYFKPEAASTAVITAETSAAEAGVQSLGLEEHRL
ncbi:MAG: insulinase family protein [Gammaproteobacteria bacterium]|nr:insulinase family protein [Gammaproteobacteria bacterium]